MSAKAFQVLGLALLAAVLVPAPVAAQRAGGQVSDHALFDGTDPASGEVGAACGARLGMSDHAIAFTLYVNVSNWSDSVQVLRILYADGSMTRFQIQPHTSFSLTQAAGGTAGVDDFLRVFAETPNPSGLAGSVSILAPAAARTHPSMGPVHRGSLCKTLTAIPE